MILFAKRIINDKFKWITYEIFTKQEILVISSSLGIVESNIVEDIIKSINDICEDEGKLKKEENINIDNSDNSSDNNDLGQTELLEDSLLDRLLKKEEFNDYKELIINLKKKHSSKRTKVSG